jgi:queuosine biosynthesis protein QueC
MVRRIYSLLSGGIDSTIATLKRIQKSDYDELQPIFIDYGQKAREQEWNSVYNVSKKLALLVDIRAVNFRNPKRIDLLTHEQTERVFGWSKSKIMKGSVGQDPYLENRNMVLLSLAASYVESQIKEHEEGIIVTGFRNEFPDTQKEFVGLMNNLFAFLLLEKKKIVSIETPIIDYGPRGKALLLKDFRKFKEIIDLTWSCYEPDNDKPCQRCEACTDRKQAFHEVFGIGH